MRSFGSSILILLYVWASTTFNVHALKRSTSFVVPSFGITDGLTLSTYMTAGADLHYAVVESGHNSLDAKTIKTAAENFDENKEISGPLKDIIHAQTVIADKAQKIDRKVTGLKPNSSYDVYFVAEVTGSNGVFGQVISVLDTLTNPPPPDVSNIKARAKYGKFEQVQVTFETSSTGAVYYGLVPSRQFPQLTLTVQDIIQRGTAVDDQTFGVFTQKTWDLLIANETISALSPSTYFDLVYVAESVSGNVFSSINHLKKYVRTHDLPPNVKEVSCSASRGTGSALTLGIDLEFTDKDNTELIDDAVGRQYEIHIEAVPSKKDQIDGSATDIQDQKSIKKTVNLSRSVDNSDTAEHLLLVQELDGVYSINVTGLDSGTNYDISVIVETKKSQGLVGESGTCSKCKTHPKAPQVKSANGNAKNGTTNSLTLSVELSEMGNVYYFFTNKGSHMLRNYMLQANDPANLPRVLDEMKKNPDVQFDVMNLQDINEDLDNKGIGAVETAFNISGLTDGSTYHFLLLPETTNSFGVYGKFYDNILEVATNQNASDVVLYEAKPHYGSVSSFNILVGMTKHQDILHYCYRCVSDSCEESDVNCEETPKNIMKNEGGNFSVSISNLTARSTYEVYVFAENQNRVEVFSKPSERLLVTTHSIPPGMVKASSIPVKAKTDSIETTLSFEEDCFVYYAIQSVSDILSETNVTAEDILGNEGKSAHNHHQSRQKFVKRGSLAISNAGETFTSEGLQPNSSYVVYVVPESMSGSTKSGVFGTLESVSAQTFSRAPKILKAIAGALNGTVDKIVLTVNMSHPGRVHYFLSDKDFADPSIIKHSTIINERPYSSRGFFDVFAEDIVMEIENGTNISKPVDPAIYTKNIILGDFVPGTLYHISLTTETFESHGVFGDFPPPLLVWTHATPPQIIENSLSIKPTDGSSTSISFEFLLSKFGDVHYILIYRGFVQDYSFPILQKRAEEEAEKEAAAVAAGEKNATEKPIWPPITSTYDIKTLSGMDVKNASIDTLGVGIWENGTISVSREDIRKGEPTQKELKNLIPNGHYELCLVTETDGSNGVFDWNGPEKACHTVYTHGDYSNQSILMDDISVKPKDASTQSIVVELSMSKLPDTAADMDDSQNGIDILKTLTNRLPYFILVDGSEGRKDFFSNSIGGSYTKDISIMKQAVQGQAHVTSSGVMTNVVGSNETHIFLREEIQQLRSNQRYYFFFAYETMDSHGFFTKLNPFRGRSNDTKQENDGIEVKTHEEAPRLTKYLAEPTFGNTSRVTAKFDMTCATCKEAIVYMLLYNENCPTPSMQILSEIAQSHGSLEKHSDEGCMYPLTSRRSVVDMSDRHDSKKASKEEDLYENLSPNTTYKIFFATETVNSSGVYSSRFVQTTVRTFAHAPVFDKLKVYPRESSTSEIILQYQLSHPGEVHYMIGESGNDEFNVTSAYNVSNKKLPGNSPPNFHDYPRDVVRSRRSLTVKRGGFLKTEVIDYLTPGTSYDIYVVVESDANKGIYGEIFEFRNISTFAVPPIILVHAAYPTPATVASLTVGFRLNTPGMLHCVAVTTGLWNTTKHVAKGSDMYGNRLTTSEEVVYQSTINVTEEWMTEGDSGWREFDFKVPYPGKNYTVYLVTETTESEGVYGTVATHKGVQAHDNAPIIIASKVTPTDARMDSLTFQIELSAIGHLHYFVIPFGHQFNLEAMDSFSGIGNVTIEDPANLTTYFTVESLKEGSLYDVYLRSETLNSDGVFGHIFKHSNPTRTHGLPPELLEDVECKVNPPCQEIGREMCGMEPNVCGPCLDGYTGAEGSANTACSMVSSETSTTDNQELFVGIPPVQEKVASEKKISIKINAVHLNQGIPAGDLTSSSSLLMDTDEVISSQNSLLEEVESNVEKDEHFTQGQHRLLEDEPLLSQEEVPALEALDSYVEKDEHFTQGQHRLLEDEPLLSQEEVTACPFHAVATGPGQCACKEGYDIDSTGTQCIPVRPNPIGHAFESARMGAEATLSP